MSLLATEKLDSRERGTYGKCKLEIQEHSKSWLAFAAAVRKVKEQRLYREEYDTFDQFCDAETPYRRSWVYDLIDAHVIHVGLSGATGQNGIDWIKSPAHLLALRNVPKESVSSVISRIDAERGSKKLTVGIIEKVLLGCGLEARKATRARKKKDVDGKVVSTVTTTTKSVNDKPSKCQPTVDGSDETGLSSPEESEEIATVEKSSPAKSEPVSESQVPAVTVQSILQGALTKVDSLDLLDELLRHLIAEGCEHTVAEICQKYAGAADPVVIQVDDQEEIARVQKAFSDHKGMIVSQSPTEFLIELAHDDPEMAARAIYRSCPEDRRKLIVDTVNSLHGAVVLPVDPAQAAWTSFSDVDDDNKKVFVETIAELWKTYSGKKNLKVNTFQKPTLEEVRAYCKERSSKVDPDQFYDHYQVSGWKLSTNVPMKDWQAAVRKWERDPRRKEDPPSPIPTLEQVEDYSSQISAWLPPSTFFDHYQGCGWMIKEGVPVTDWKAVFRRWNANPRTEAEKLAKQRKEFGCVESTPIVSDQPEPTDDEKMEMLKAKLAKIPKVSPPEQNGGYTP